MLRIVFAWLALIMQLDYSSAARTCFLASLCCTISMAISAQYDPLFLRAANVCVGDRDRGLGQGREGGRLITVGYNSWRVLDGDGDGVCFEIERK